LPAAAALLCLLLAPIPASASSSGAFDKYQSGDYQAAFDEYSRLAAQKTNDYRLQYDAGTAAYRARQLDAAQKQLGAVLNSPAVISDLNTQEHAYYNLGNTLYHLGEPAPDPKQKQERWEQSIANYSKALQLNTNDLDARNNLEFVKKKLEELKQQQQQQQQNDQKNQDQKDQKQQNQSQQNKDQKNQDQKNQQNRQNQQDQKGGQSQQQQSQDQKSAEDKQREAEQKQQQQQQAQRAQQDQQNQSGQPTPAGQDQRDKSADQNQQAADATEAPMTLQEAQQMLDAQKEDEKALIFSAENKPAQSADAKIKDW
jgi:Ca-activated chloride channel family protein